jgi:hypothetical protein
VAVLKPPFLQQVAENEQMSDPLSQELIAYAVTGLLASVVIVKLVSGPALFKIDSDEDGEQVSAPTEGITSSPSRAAVESKQAEASERATPDQSILSGTKDVEKIPVINEEYAKKKLAPLQNLLGLTDEQMSKAIKDTNNEIAHDPSSLDASDNLARSVDVVVLIAGLLFCFYALNVYSHGDLGRMVLGMFPAELRALGIADYLEKFR